MGGISVGGGHGGKKSVDSEIPLIVANPNETAKSIGVRVKKVLADRPYQQKITDIILELRKH